MSNTVPVDFNGTYKLDRAENFDEFLAAMGINFLMRKMAGTAKPQQIISQDGNNFNITTKGLKENKISFVVGGAEYEAEQMGKTMIGSASWEGNKLVNRLKPKKAGEGKELVNTRELINDELVQTLNVGNGEVVCTQYFKRQS